MRMCNFLIFTIIQVDMTEFKFAAVKIDPIGCESAPGTCAPLNAWWRRTALDVANLGQAHYDHVWRLSCLERTQTCE